MNNKDTRILKTRRSIHMALFELLQEQTTYKISISDVSKKAGINRKTFYNHYTSVDDVIEDIRISFLREFEKSVLEIGVSGARLSLYTILKAFLSVFESDADFYRKLFQTEIGTSVFLSVYNSFCKYFFNIIKADIVGGNRIPNILAADFTTSGCFFIIYKWFSNGCNVPIEKLSGELENIIRRVFSQGVAGIYKM